MTTKQLDGVQSPDGSTYICFTDGNGNLEPTASSSVAGNKISGMYAPDGAKYVTITNGNGTLE